jgi:hypothetical protein
MADDVDCAERLWIFKMRQPGTAGTGVSGHCGKPILVGSSDRRVEAAKKQDGAWSLRSL